MKKILLLVCFLGCKIALGQNYNSIADSIRNEYKIPGLAYAIVQLDSSPILGFVGYTQYQGSNPITLKSKFSLGSCSKSITSLLAAKLIAEGKLDWNTQFFSVFPKLKKEAKKEYHKITLENLLSHRTQLISLTGQGDEPNPCQLLNDTSTNCRYNLAKWILTQKPNLKNEVYNYSNAGYVLAGLMLEKTTGKSWEQLTTELLKEAGIHPTFRFPNEINLDDVWFHDQNLNPIPPEKNFESGCNKAIAPAGMVFLDIQDMARYIRIHLEGRVGKSSFLTQSAFDTLHFGLPEYAMGWMWREKDGQRILAHSGNSAGWTFCEMRIYEKDKIGIAVFANAGNEQTMKGMLELRKKLYELFK